jgi:diguanylate cyclase (GGDEF)-like protein
MGMLLMAMAGDDVSLEARRLLRRLRVEGRGDLRNASLLQLALALSDADAGRRAAARETEAAVAALDPEAQSHLYDLAIHLSAEIEAGFTGHSAGLRSARRHLEHHWAKRLSSLGAMRTLIRAERQSNEIEVLSRHARLDDLTGIGNRRALAEYLSNLERLEVERIALVVLDVDNFKFVNDNYGHLAGDSVLVGVARQLELGIRPTDLVVRLGGDEFAVLLADVDLETAFERALGLLHQVDRHSFDEVSPGLLATLSAGVAAGTPSALRDLWSEADAALYRAKGGGGQRVIRSRLAPASGRPSGSGVAAASNHLLRAHRHDDDLTRVEAR